MALTKSGGVGIMVVGLLACGDDPERDRLPWQPEQTTVISHGGQAETIASLPSDTCVAPPDAPADYCLEAADVLARCVDGETTTEVVVDRDGEVLDVVCIPPDVEAVEPLDLADGEIDQTGNSTALIFEDGQETFAGDLTVDGNKVVLYGASPEVATIDGTLTLEGNNSIVRGVTITGDLRIAKNNPVVVYCVVEGDVYLEANGSRISGCDIWGDVYVTGNGAALHGNRIGGSLEDGGQNTACSGNRAFEDSDADGIIDEAEVGDPLSCSASEG